MGKTTKSRTLILSDLLVVPCWQSWPITTVDDVSLQTTDSLTDELVGVWHWPTYDHISSTQ